VPVHAGLTSQARAQEHTQRSRSFLLTTLATVAAFMEQSDRVLFYENGIMSINLPIATQVVGARASRSTHPRSLMLLQQLARSIRVRDVTIDNPFIRKTKVEVVRDLKDRPEGNLIRHTLSCSRTRDMSYYKPHCGRCAQCLQRRLSTLGAEASDLDPAEAYAVDLLIGPRQGGDDRVMAVEMMRSALEFRRMADAAFATRYAGEFAWLTDTFPGQAPSDVAHSVVDTFRRHGEFVWSVFRQAAVDDIQKCILVDGLGPLTSPTDYRIVSVLAELFREDREVELAPENCRTLSATELAEKASIAGDQACRKAVSRLREKIDQEHQELYGSTLGQDAVIENVWGKGYRINPSVRIVSPSQLRGR
jgi:Queuosine biosynthesis protein QueC